MTSETWLGDDLAKKSLAEFHALLTAYSVTQVHQLPHAISLGEKDRVLLDFSTQT